VTGAWSVDLDPDFGGNADTIGCTFKQEAQNVTGECGHGGSEPPVPVVGQVKDRTLTFEFKTAGGMTRPRRLPPVSTTWRPR
jgi:hypothetical protein